MRVGYDRGQPAAAPVHIHERERPVGAARHSVHVDREATETRHDVHPFNPHSGLNSIYLEAPPAREGFIQRWVVDGTKDNSDNTAQRNWWVKQRAGWRPRDPASVPPQLRALYPSTKLADGSDCIRIGTSVLCELPLQVARARGDAVRDLVVRQASSIPDSTDELRKQRREGVGPLKVEDQEQAGRGQNPEFRTRGLPTMKD